MGRTGTFADQWVVCPVFAWFVGSLTGLWWFVNGLDGLDDLWMISSFTANDK